MISVLLCKHCNRDVIASAKPNGPHISAYCNYCNKFIKHLKKPKMPYEAKPGDVTIFKNTTDNPKAPQYTGTCITPDGTTYRISLWVKEGQKGKFFSGKIEEPRQQNVQNSTSKDDDIPF
jgi:hypothetical protein